jgi:hypothetical protein
MRGKRTSLVESVLDGSFRPDRHGRRLLEETLPEECPLENVSLEGARAWRDLVTGQRGYQDAGAVNPWAFARLVRALHGTLRHGEVVSGVDHFRVESALRIGSYPALPDEVLEPHWREWASLEEWDDPTDYAYWRFRTCERGGVGEGEEDP